MPTPAQVYASAVAPSKGAAREGARRPACRLHAHVVGRQAAPESRQHAAAYCILSARARKAAFSIC